MLTASNSSPRDAPRIVIVGGGAGATGTELAAEPHCTIREVAGYGLDRIDPARKVCIILIEAGDRILNRLPERVSQATHHLLTAMEVEIRTGARVTEITA